VWIQIDGICTRKAAYTEHTHPSLIRGSAKTIVVCRRIRGEAKAPVPRPTANRLTVGNRFASPVRIGPR